MENSHSLPFTSLFARLRVYLLNEKEFCTEIAKSLSELERYGLRLKVTVKENESVFAEYGAPGSCEPCKSDSVRESSFVIGFSGWPTTGNTAQDNIQAEVVWDEYFNALRNIFSEHWRCRKASSGLWNGEDSSVDTKRRNTVKAAVTQSKPVAYVRLDCDGVGEMKQKLGGEEKTTEVINRVARYFQNQLNQHCLTIHPHGDEFTLIFIGYTPRHVLAHLVQFQNNFNIQDFRPSNYPDAIYLGVKMAVAFWYENGGEQSSANEYAALQSRAEQVDFNVRVDRGFIELAQSNTIAVGPISSQAIHESVLWARQGLATSETSIFKNDLHDLIADILVHHPDGTSLSQYLDSSRFIMGRD